MWLEHDREKDKTAARAMFTPTTGERLLQRLREAIHTPGVVGLLLTTEIAFDAHLSGGRLIPEEGTAREAWLREVEWEGKPVFIDPDPLQFRACYQIRQASLLEAIRAGRVPRRGRVTPYAPEA